MQTYIKNQKPLGNFMQRRAAAAACPHFHHSECFISKKSQWYTLIKERCGSLDVPEALNFSQLSDCTIFLRLTERLEIQTKLR